MDEVETVTVYAFQLAESAPEDFRLAPFKATREAVVDLHGGEVLEGTGEEVALDQLDSQGRYRRIATGWGALV